LVVSSKSALGATTVPLNAFSLVAGTFDGAQLTVYLNGAVDGSFPVTTNLIANTLPLRIGADSNGTNTFNGLVDEVMVFNRALSVMEVQTIYNTGAAGLCKGAGFSAIAPDAGGQIRLTLGGRTGGSFRLDASTNLLNWVPLATLTNASGSLQYDDATAANFNHRFYRLLAP